MLECRVAIGNCKDFGRYSDPNGEWYSNYDSCKAIHPPWSNNRTSSEFQEWCIKDESKCKIYRIIFQGKSYRMHDYKKFLNLYTKKF